MTQVSKITNEEVKLNHLNDNSSQSARSSISDLQENTRDSRVNYRINKMLSPLMQRKKKDLESAKAFQLNELKKFEK